MPNNSTTTEMVYEFIQKFIKEHTYPPTIREIGQGCYISTSAVSRHLDHLERRGKISREFGRARGITLLNDSK